jgi:hypothetical protein
LKEHVHLSSVGMEILCRRLSGVTLADSKGNWDCCKAVEWPYASESLLDQAQLFKAYKDAATIARLRERGSKSTSSGGKSFNRRNFHGDRSSSKSNNFNTKKSGVGPKAGAAQQ